jgi:hypothetical protein
MTNFSPISDFSFPTFRLSDFPTFSDHSPALRTIYYYIIIPRHPTTTRSDELQRGVWPCSVTFGAVDGDHECHLHEAKSALPFRLSQFPTFRFPVFDFLTLPFRLSDFPTFRLSDFSFPAFRLYLSDFPTFRLSDFSFPAFRLYLSNFPTF